MHITLKMDNTVEQLFKTNPIFVGCVKSLAVFERKFEQWLNDRYSKNSLEQIIVKNDFNNFVHLSDKNEVFKPVNAAKSIKEIHQKYKTNEMFFQLANEKLQLLDIYHFESNKVYSQYGFQHTTKLIYDLQTYYKN